MSLFASAYAQAGNPAPAQPNPLISLLPLVFIFLIFYFLIIRPQQQRQREHGKMITELKKNDEVVTQGGIHGTVVNVKENTLILRLDENVRVEVDKFAIARRKSSPVETTN